MSAWYANLLSPPTSMVGLGRNKCQKASPTCAFLPETFGVAPQDFIGTIFDVSEGVMDAFEFMRTYNTVVPSDQNLLVTALMELLGAVPLSLDWANTDLELVGR